MSGEALSTVNTQPLLADCLDWSGQSTVDISCDKSRRCGKSCERESNRRVHTYSRPKSFQFYRACVIMCDHVWSCVYVFVSVWVYRSWDGLMSGLRKLDTCLGLEKRSSLSFGWPQHRESRAWFSARVFHSHFLCHFHCLPKIWHLCILVPLVLWLLQPYRFSSVSTLPIQSLQTSPSF